MVLDYFDPPIAYNPDAEDLVTGATFQVFAVDDSAYATPLPVTDPASGANIPVLASNNVGVLPAFRVSGDPAQVVLKSGAFTTLLTSRYGIFLEVVPNPEQLLGALAASAAAAESAATAADLVANLPASIADALNAADIPGVIDEAVTEDIEGRELVERYPGDPLVEWRWYFAYADGEVAFGQRSDGSWYPADIGASFSDQSVTELDGSQGWRFAVHYEDGEVAFGQRTDGSWYPESLGGATISLPPVRISGDSLTGGWAGYVSGLSSLLGMPVIAQGDGGRRSDWIAARQGGQPLRISSNTNVIPASGPVAVTIAVYNHIGTTPPLYVASNYTGVLGGIPGTLTITDDTNGVGTFTRTAAGRETPLPAGTPFIRTQHRDAWPIIWAGRNNFKLANDGAQIVRDVGDMLAWTQEREHALVLSIPPWVGEENGTGVRNTLNAANAMLRDAFPVEFVDTAAMLRSAALLEAVGITPTATDLANIANGLTPESFRAPGDSGHLGAKGYEALNMLIRDVYVSRGWIV